MSTPTRVPPEEFDSRLECIREHLAETDADAGIWFGATSIEYLTGFDHIQTERPVILAVTDEEVALTVPRLEVDRVQENPWIDIVAHYDDYPAVSTRPRTITFVSVLRSMLPPESTGTIVSSGS